MTLTTNPHPTDQEMTQDDRLLSCLLAVAEMETRPASRAHQKRLARMARALLVEAGVLV